MSYGCAQIVDFPKFIWGNSTKALEKGRATAITKTYRCSVQECFDEVLKLTVPPKVEEEEVITPPIQSSPHLSVLAPTNPAQNAIMPAPPPDYLGLYIKNRKKNFIVVMGVPNCVNTTEVGIFFTPVDNGNVKVELSSLSTKAKKNAAEMVFKVLGEHFPEIE